MIAMFEALAHPDRLRIVEVLRERERSVGELVRALGMRQPGVSKHLRTLRSRGLVKVRAEGPRRWYRLNPEPLAELDSWLVPYRRLWAHSVAGFEPSREATLQS